MHNHEVGNEILGARTGLNLQIFVNEFPFFSTTAICTPPCQNNGICYVGDDNTTAVCSCTSEWGGQYCDERKIINSHTLYYVNVSSNFKA